MGTRELAEQGEIGVSTKSFLLDYGTCDLWAFSFFVSFSSAVSIYINLFNARDLRPRCKSACTPL